MNHLAFLPLLITAFLSVGAFGFTAPHQSTLVQSTARSSATLIGPYNADTASSSFPKFATVALHAEAAADASAADPSEVIARRIIVVGDVDGGYYRSCVKNEVRVCCLFKTI